MVNPKKVAACTMAFTMAMSAVFAGGCSKKNKGANETVSADDEWYNISKMELASDYDPSEFDYLSNESLGKVGDYFLVETNGSYKLPEGADYMTADPMEYYAEFIDVFDINGDKVNTIDVVDTIKNSGLVEELQANAEAAAAAMDELPAEEGEDADDQEETSDLDEIEEIEEEPSEEDEEVSGDEEASEADEEIPGDEEISDEEFFEGDMEEIGDMGEMDPTAPSYYINGVSVAGDKVKVSVSAFDLATFSDVSYEFIIDPATGDATYSLADNSTEYSGGSEGISDLGVYKVDRQWVTDPETEESFYDLVISDESGIVNEINLAQALPDEDIYWINSIFYIGGQDILVTYQGSDYNGVKTLKINVTSGDVTVDEGGDYDWLSDYDLTSASYVEGFGNVFMDDEGIQVVDFDNQTVESIFSFDSCNINRGDVTSMKLISYSEDEIILMGGAYRISMSMTDVVPQQLIVLTKADSNPNAGKTILKAATIGYIDYAMSEAVCIFNETNPDYFIKFETKYQADKMIDSTGLDTEEEWREASDNAAIELSNQLTVDLMAGEGPDIIFDASRLSQLNNDEYLLDVADRISTDGLFGSVVDAAKIDGKLYQIPLSFYVTGLAVLEENVADGQTGFTFDQYSEFVSTVCNGTDPLSMDQTEFFIMCLAAMSEQFVDEEGNVNYDNEAFRALAEYTNENVIAPEESEEDTYDMGSMGDSLTEAGAIQFDYGSFLGLISLIGDKANETKILGIPSIDGRGPMLSVDCSVAISAQTNEADACWSFVETLMSADVQKYYASSSGGTPISIEAYEESATESIDSYNDMISTYTSYFSAAEIAMYGIPTETIDYDVIDTYETMIDSCSAVSTTDPAVEAIIREEMPAYFAGQKTLDDVISVIEDRVQTFIDERG